MKFKIDFKNKKIIFIIGLIIVLMFFYWYEWRPSQIMKECSWVKVVEPAKEAITKKEAEYNKKKYENCMMEKKEEDKEFEGWTKLNLEALAEIVCASGEVSEREYIPEKVYYRKAIDSEYDFCIHASGLK